MKNTIFLILKGVWCHNGWELSGKYLNYIIRKYDAPLFVLILFVNLTKQ